MRTKHCCMYLLPFVAALLAPSSHAAPEAPAPQGPGSAVVVNGGVAGPMADRVAIMPSLDPLLWAGSASSCGFMAPYDPRYDPVTVAYMRDFGMMNSRSYDPFQVTEYAPLVDASLPVEDLGRGLSGGALRSHPPGRVPSGCSGADLNFAAGRMHIVRHDKSLVRGFDAFARKDYARALEQFTEAWNKVGYRGVPALMLARMHLYGLGTPQDTGKAAELLDKVAGLTYSPAARMRFNPARPDAMTPMVEAAWLLAQIYDHGIGTAPDRKLARKWYQRAADLGFVPALDMLALQDLPPDASPRAREHAIEQLKEAAAAGYPPAQYHLARAYYEGDGVPRDLRLAGAYFDAAAHAGLAVAQYAAGRMVDQGEGVPADPRKALIYYKDAALKGNRDAEFALGTYFYGGEVLPKDAATARKWFAAAARQGQPDAMFNLGVMTARGEGGTKDPAVAYVWLALAAQAGQAQAGAGRDLLAPTLSAQERKRAYEVLSPNVASAQ